MTNEGEEIEILKAYRDKLSNSASNQLDKDIKAFDAAIKALEDKVKVLDKIRAEIEALNPVDYVSMSSYEGHKGASDMKNDVLQIIDKYRGEAK